MKLPDRHVIAALLHLVLDIASSLIALVAQHFGEYPFQRIVTHFARQGLIAIITDVNRSAIEMATLLSSIGIMTLQLSHILHRTQHTGDNELVERQSLGIKTVVECLADVLQHQSGSWYEVRNRAGQAVDMPVRTLSDIH